MDEYKREVGNEAKCWKVTEHKRSSRQNSRQNSGKKIRLDSVALEGKRPFCFPWFRPSFMCPLSGCEFKNNKKKKVEWCNMLQHSVILFPITLIIFCRTQSLRWYSPAVVPEREEQSSPSPALTSIRLLKKTLTSLWVECHAQCECSVASGVM